MNPDEKSVLLRIDMRGPSRAADCFDCVVAAPAAVEYMRAASDFGVAHAMVDGTTKAFQSLESDDHNGLLFVAAEAQDLLYQYVAQLMVMDRYTRVYCSVVVRHFFEQLSERGLRTFYILDNTLRDDRFEAMLELFDLSGVVTTTPNRDGISWSPLANKLRVALDAGEHVAYIEPDALANHLDAARQLAIEIPCVATFRNLGPEDPKHEIINFKAAWPS